MTNKELYLELSNKLSGLIGKKGYHFSISFNGGYDNCPSFISIYIHYYNEIIKSEWISVKDSGFKDKYKKLNDYIDEKIYQ